MKLSSLFSASPSQTRLKQSQPPAVTEREVRKIYERPRSFTDFLPWTEFMHESGCFVLEDGISVGAALDITPAGSEARDDEYMAKLQHTIQVALADAIPESTEHPWILQTYLQDEDDLSSVAKEISNYGEQRALSTGFSKHFREIFEEHLQRISKAGGLFHDEKVTGARWRGQLRRIRMTLYRRDPSQSPVEAENQLNVVVNRLTTALGVAGVTCKRMRAEEFASWLLPWFNPQSDQLRFDVADCARDFGARAKSNQLVGYDFAEQLTMHMPRSDNENGVWWFGDTAHEYLTIETLRRVPRIGHLSAEHEQGDNVFALFDRFPRDSIFVMSCVVESQPAVENRIARIKRSAVGDSAGAELTREDAIASEREMARGEKIFSVSLGVYVRGENVAEVKNRMNQVSTLLLPNGFHPLVAEADLLKLDSYLRNLPMAYDPKLDKLRRRGKLMFTKHVANLLPVYGRSRGTGNSGFVFFNRGAEPLTFDPLNAADRKKNGHMLILGPTGAGKSAMLVYLLQQMVARHKPRVFIIEAGGSFELLGHYFRAHGLSVNQVTLNASSDVSLPPFADALSIVDSTQLLEDSALDSSSQDRLGEMEIIARVMVTGGDVKEHERLTRPDRLLIRTAIVEAVKNMIALGRQGVLTENVRDALQIIGRDPELPDHRRLRALEMADALSLFCSGIAGHFFNRPGTAWPDVDVTILEMGLLAREGYEDQLTIAYLSIMSHINNVVEKQQHSDRQTLVVTDEGHIITTHPLLASYVVKITKMWRKFGAWFWIATQNLSDFPDASQRMLNMIEWWLCLVMPKDEVEHVSRFRELNDSQRKLLLSARKEPGKFVEGVVLSDQIETLFRNVPPALTLALAMSEKHEKAERHNLMDEFGCSEYEAAVRVADRIKSRG